MCWPSTRATTHETPRPAVFSTRSQDRPNPIGLHRVVIVAQSRNVAAGVLVRDLEGRIDRTPVVDVKPVLPGGR